MASTVWMTICDVISPGITISVSASHNYVERDLIWGVALRARTDKQGPDWDEDLRVTVYWTRPYTVSGGKLYHVLVVCTLSKRWMWGYVCICEDYDMWGLWVCIKVVMMCNGFGDIWGLWGYVTVVRICKYWVDMWRVWGYMRICLSGRLPSDFIDSTIVTLGTNNRKHIVT